MKNTNKEKLKIIRDYYNLLNQQFERKLAEKEASKTIIENLYKPILEKKTKHLELVNNLIKEGEIGNFLNINEHLVWHSNRNYFSWKD